MRYRTDKECRRLNIIRGAKTVRDRKKIPITLPAFNLKVDPHDRQTPRVSETNQS